MRKVVGGTTTEYTVNGTKVVHVAKGSEWLHVYYDGQGRPGIVSYKGTIYHYMYNLQGDVVGLVDGTGNVVVEYRYDAWGKVIGKTGSLANTLGNLNPFRYRGYVYDEETGLYYLRSRYYNPGWGRFINADVVLGQVGGLLSHNVFAYCRNNPVKRKDISGRADSDYNCYAYALGIYDRMMKPGGAYRESLNKVDVESFWNPEPTQWYSAEYFSVYSMADAVIGDVGVDNAYIIQEGDVIEDGWYKIALRTGYIDRDCDGLVDKTIFGEVAGDFHFMRCDDGKWSHKRGGGKVEYLRDGETPSTTNWGFCLLNLYRRVYYDSPIVFMAIRKDR